MAGVFQREGDDEERKSWKKTLLKNNLFIESLEGKSWLYSTVYMWGSVAIEL